MNVVVFRDRAKRDVDFAVTYYESQGGTALGLRFVHALRVAATVITGQPGVGSPQWSRETGVPGLRSWPVKGFPFLMFYIDAKGVIEVTRVLHTSRDIPASLRD